jgi:hypothetical protein
LRLTLTESTGALTLPLWISRSKLPHAESLPAFYCAALNYRNDEMNAAAVVVLDDAVGMSLPRVVFRNDVRLLITVDGFQAGDAISRLEIQAFSGTLEEILT